MNTDKNMKVVYFEKKKKKESLGGGKGADAVGYKVRCPEISFRTDATSKLSEHHGCMVAGPDVVIQCNRFER